MSRTVLLAKKWRQPDWIEPSEYMQISPCPEQAAKYLYLSRTMFLSSKNFSKTVHLWPQLTWKKGSAGGADNEHQLFHWGRLSEGENMQTRTRRSSLQFFCGALEFDQKSSLRFLLKCCSNLWKEDIAADYVYATQKIKKKHTIYVHSSACAGGMHKHAAHMCFWRYTQKH